MPAWVITRNETGSEVLDRASVYYADREVGGGLGSIGDDGVVTYDDEGVTTVAGWTLQQQYSRESWNGTIVTEGDSERETGTWSGTDLTETLDGDLLVTYALAGTSPGASVQEVFAVPELALQFLADSTEQWQPGTLRFRLGSKEYRDGGSGILYLADGTTVAGRIDYGQRTVYVSNWSGAGTAVQILSLVTSPGAPSTQLIAGYTDGAPLSVGQFYVRATELDGDAITGQGQADETVTGTGIAAGSTVRWDIGAFSVRFENPVYNLVRYDAVATEILALSEAQTGIDATRLPRNGYVPIFRPTDAILIHQTDRTAMPNPLSAGQVVDTGVEKLARVELLDANGAEQTEQLPSGLTSGATFQALASAPSADRLCQYLLLDDAAGRHVDGALFTADVDTALVTMANPLDLTGYLEPLTARYVRRVRPALYSADLVAGTIAMANPLDLSAYTQPLQRVVRWEDQNRIRYVRTDGELGLVDDVDHDYDAGEALVSGLVENGNLSARVLLTFGQQTWQDIRNDANEWPDTVTGNAVSIYDTANYPIEVTNDGAITAQMALIFTSTTAFNLYIADRGVVASGTKSADFAPINPASITKDNPTGSPYLRVAAAGWSATTATGNALRVNTRAAAASCWAIMSVQIGDPSVADDSFEIELRVDSD